MKMLSIKIARGRGFLAQWASWIAVCLVLAAPRIAEACAVCSAGREDQTRTAFIIGTAFMTALPMVLVGGMVWWVRKKTLEAQELEAPARELDPAPERPSRASSSL